MYRAVAIDNEFQQRLHSTIKFLIMDIINKRIDLGIEDESENGNYIIYPSDFNNGPLYLGVHVTDINFDTEIESQRVTEIHLEKNNYFSDIFVTLETGDEVFLNSLTHDSIIRLGCELEDYLDELTEE